jgi:DNA-binding IclR family transcriptional regulator
VAKAIEALEHVRSGPLPLSAMADRLGVHSSTALRMLAPMVEAGLLARADGRYRLGLHLAEFGQDVLDTLDLRAVAHPQLVALSAATRCTVHLAQLVDDAIVYVDKVEVHGTIRTWSRVGRQVPLHTTAASKAILAGLPAADRDRLLAGWEFTAHSPRTLTGADALKRRLDEVEARGFAIDEAEFDSLVHCVGVPQRTPRRSVLVTIGAQLRERDVGLRVIEQGIDTPSHRVWGRRPRIRGMIRSW